MFDLETSVAIVDPPPRPYGRGHDGRGLAWAGAVTDTAASGSDTVHDPMLAAMLAVRERRDEAAFARLFGHFAPRLKAFLIKGGAVPAQAEDLAQEVMATVWHKAAQFDPGRASVATWIFTIARNRRIDALRRARRPEPEDLPWGPEDAPSPHDVLALQQDSARLASAMAALPEGQRVLVERAFWGELSHTEIAAETGLPLGTIKSRIRLALDKLRHRLDLTGTLP